MESQLPILLIAVPLLTAPVCVFLGRAKLAYLLAMVASWCTFALSVSHAVSRCSAKRCSTMIVRLRTSVIGAPPYGIEYRRRYLLGRS